MSAAQLGMTSENGFLLPASEKDRIASIATKLKELTRIAQVGPQDPALIKSWCAMFAQQLDRCHQFSWKLLQDMERKKPSE